MYWTNCIFALMLFSTLMVAMSEASDAKRIRAEIVTKADSLFKERYTPRDHQPLPAFDKDRESRPADVAIYRFNASYVVRLVFATDGSLVRVELFPETLLYSDSWTSVPDSVELGAGEVRWGIAAANQLRPIGDPVSHPPHVCFQSGHNLYCDDTYELAKVSTYCLEDSSVSPPHASPRIVTTFYKQSVTGIVSELKAVSKNEHHVKVAPLWYRIHRDPNQSSFDTTAVGSMVSLTSFGCAGNELVCDALPATVEH